MNRFCWLAASFLPLITPTLHAEDGVQVKIAVERIDAPDQKKQLEVFTDQPALLREATFVLVAPEHPERESVTASVLEEDAQAYSEATERMSETLRSNSDRETSGQFLGSYAIHPLSGWRLPIWMSNHVLPSDPTSSILGIPTDGSWLERFADAHEISSNSHQFLVDENGDQRTPADDLAFLEEQGLVRRVNGPPASEKIASGTRLETEGNRTQQVESNAASARPSPRVSPAVYASKEVVTDSPIDVIHLVRFVDKNVVVSPVESNGKRERPFRLFRRLFAKNEQPVFLSPRWFRMRHGAPIFHPDKDRKNSARA